MPPLNHGKISPSAFARIIACPGSVKLSALLPESPVSPAAAEGTAAHALGEHKIRKALKQRSKRPVCEYDSDEMELYTDDYRDFVMNAFNEAKASYPGAQLLLEQRVDFSNYCPDGFGTADAVIVSNNKLHIIDLKFGINVLVSAENNPQLSLYSIGCLNMLSDIYDFETVEMTIFQPRRDNISSWVITVDELIKWAEEVVKPTVAEALSDNPSYHPGEDACLWCKARATCRARAEYNMAMMKYEFAMPDTLLDEEIPLILEKADHLKKWIGDVQDYALAQALKGKQWDGYKLVNGRGKTAYKDEDAVIEACKKAGYTDIFNKKLISLTDMKKLLGREDFKAVVEPLTEKRPGSITLVPESDKRKALLINAKQEFKEEK